jgi:XTP/dITP diphosphohydrolase
LKFTENRAAIAEICVAYIEEPGQVKTFKAVVNGSISEIERGTNGFAWDSIFIPQGYDQTYGEMTIEIKNSLSMRKICLEQFKDFLKQKNQLM